MNVTGAGTQGSTGATSTATPSRNGERRDNQTAGLAQPQAEFELALRARQSRRNDEDGAEGERGRDEPSDSAMAALAGSLLAPAGALRAVEETPPPSVPRTFDAPPTASRAAVETALNLNLTPSVTAIGETDPAALWEASVHEPNAIPVDVRVLRTERGGQETNAAWTVSVKSSSVSAETLSRHAPRLNERLRKHGAGFSHVRIEQDEPGQE